MRSRAEHRLVLSPSSWLSFQKVTGFGEEALVSDAVRNASITMLTDGELMRLTKEDFVDLIKKPVLNEVSYVKAESLVASGATWLDVRGDEEYRETGIAGGVNIPLRLLRSKLSELDKSTRYVVYCDTGSRSSVAAFLLTQNGLEVSYLSGGLMKSPMAHVLEATLVRAPGKKSPKEKAHKREKIPKSAAAGNQATIKTPDKKSNPGFMDPVPLTGPTPVNDDLLEADIRVSALDAELARANLRIEEAIKQKQEAQHATKRCELQAEQAVQRQRERLDAQAVKLRQEANQAKRQLMEAAQGKIQQEREKLEAESQRLKAETNIAKRAAEEVAEKTIEREREKLEAQTAYANQVLEEAQRLKQELEVTKKKADEDASRKRSEEEAELESMKKRAQAHLRRESQKLEEEYARNADELSRLKQAREEQEEQLREERCKMDEQVIEARKKLEEARSLKQEAEASRRAVELDLAAKRKDQDQMERRMREQVNKKIHDERLKLEAEFARQAAELERMQAEREAADVARQAAQDEAQRIIAEYKEEYEKSLVEKQAHERELAEKEEHIRHERERLEQEQAQVEATLTEARRAKDEADQTRVTVERRVIALRAAEADRSTKREEEDRLHAEIAAIEVEMAEATQQLEHAEKAQQRAEAAAKENEETLSRQKDDEEALRSQLVAEVTAWRKESAEQDNKVDKTQKLVLEKDQLERIKRRAAEAKRQAEDANADLFGDIAKQLN